VTTTPTPTTKAPVAIGEVIAERYRIDGIVGEGGMGIVVVATHLVLQQKVAIKFLKKESMKDADAVRRFVREARAAAKVKSEFVVNVHDVASLEDGTPYIVMEFVDGRSLRAMLDMRGALPVNEAVRYMVQVCEALAETHAAGIVHGDLKPDNIYIAGSIEGSGRVKLLDFGISKFAENESGRTLLLGTPAYMAPEQIEHKTVDPRTDLWSLGVVLYEMLAGDQPFKAPKPDKVCDAVLKEQPAPLTRSRVPDKLKFVVSKCLEKDPAMRYRSSVELAMALADYAPLESSIERVVNASKRRGTEPSVQRFVPTVVVPRRGRTRSWAIVALGVLGVLAVAMILVLALSAQKTPKVARAATTPAKPVVSESAPSASTTVAVDEPPPSATPSATAPPPPKKPRAAKPVQTTAAPQPTSEGDRFGTRK
jgi:serine/threonine-protein kinase